MKIYFLHPSDVFRVIGSTEPYYVLRFLAQRYDVGAVIGYAEHTAIPEWANSLDSLHLMRRGKSRIFGNLWFNLKAAALLLGERVGETDVLYSYLGISLPVVVAKWLRGCQWVVDVRSSPVQQDSEFAALRGDRSLATRLRIIAKRALYRFALPRADLVVCISEEIATEICQFYSVSPDRIFVQPLGVDVGAFRAKGGLQPGKRSPRDFQLVYVGSISKQRGISTVLEALAIVRKKGVPASLVVVGTGPRDDLEFLAGYSDRQGVNDFVEWKGMIPHEEIPGILRNADAALCVLPDIEAYRVSSPGKLFEYLAVPTALIATDIRAHRKVLTDGVNALLIPADRPVELAGAVERLFRSEDLRERLKEGAAKTVADFDWDVLLPRLVEEFVAPLQRTE